MSPKFSRHPMRSMLSRKGWCGPWPDITKLSGRYIEGIEEENYKKLPARPYLRGFLVLYTKAIGYEPDRIVNDYLKRYDATLIPPKK